MEGVSREIRLVARPRGFPDEELFEVAETAIPDPADGQVLIRNAFFSVDPYMRPRMNDVRSYVAPFTLGEAMTGGAVGQVAASRNAEYSEGDWVLHQLGWREWALSDGAALRRLDPGAAPVSTSLGVLGMPGFTAWYGLFVLGRPRGGRDGARLRRRGRRRERRRTDGGDRRLSRDRQRGLGGEARRGCASSASTPSSTTASSARARRSRELAPDGIDVYFDNVGGDHLEAAIGAARTYGRVVACGSIARYNDAEPSPGPRNMFMVVTKRLRIEGFIIRDHYDRFGEFAREATEWVRDGRLQLPRDGRRRDRERAEGVPRAAARGEHREDARAGRSGGVRPAAGSSGTAAPPTAFFLTERYQRCERAGSECSCGR